LFLLLILYQPRKKGQKYHFLDGFLTFDLQNFLNI
jgi:hypothetical protein